MGSANGTLTWAARRSVGIPLGLLIYGVVISILAAPGLVAMNHFYPEALPFAWLALIITLLSSLGHARRNGLDDGIVEKMGDLNKSEKYEYLMNLTFMVSGIITFHVIGTAAIAAFTVFYLGFPVIGLLLVIALPKADAYLGRNYDASLGALGFHIANSLLKILSLISGMSSVPAEAAAHDARSVL